MTARQAAWTRGPWRVNERRNVVGMVNGKEEVIALVADMPCVNGHDDLAAQRGSDMERANAALIADAPNMDRIIELILKWTDVIPKVDERDRKYLDPEFLQDNSELRELLAARAALQRASE